MTNHAADTSPLIYARVAGLLALIALASGSFAGFVNTRLVVPADAVTTAKNIMASEALFRLGIVSGLIMYAVFILYALMLYKLLTPVNKNYALLMVVFALAGVPIAMLNQINQSDSLSSAFSFPELRSAGLLTFRSPYCGNVMDVVAID